MLSQVKPKHLKKATPLKMNGTPLLKCLMDRDGGSDRVLRDDIG